MNKLHIVSFSLLLLLSSCIIDHSNNKDSFPELSGPFLGQKLPGNEPELFAPRIVSTAMYTRDIAMMPDGNEIYFCVSAFGYNLIFFTKQVNGKWTEPAPAPFISDFDHMFYEPHIMQDGKRMLFLSNMPTEEDKEGEQDIWAVDRIGDGWGTPYNLGEPVNSKGSEFFPSTTRDGIIYFTRQPEGERSNYIFRTRLINGTYSEAEKLPEQVNCGTDRYNAFIDPDERFIIVPAVGMKDGFGGTDYYIVFRNEDDKWSEPVNMGDKVNQKTGREWSPYISPDGKYFFFMSSRTLLGNEFGSNKPVFSKLKEMYNQPGNGNSDIFWMKADFISDLKNKAKWR